MKCSISRNQADIEHYRRFNKRDLDPVEISLIFRCSYTRHFQLIVLI